VSADSPFESSLDAEKNLRAELISNFNLSATAVDKIYEAMETTDSSFSETAMRLGYVTAEQVATARKIVRGEVEPDQTGLIENALRRVALNRQLIVRQGERVKPGESLVLAHDPDNPRSERLRALRTELLLLNEETRRANIIPILSPGAGEGRSQLAAELAISFAQLGRRTLLVDADLRKPQQHVLFSTANEHGLFQAVAQNEKLNYHPVTGLPQMHVLTAGPIPPNPLELLSDGRFEKLLSDWRNYYEFVVIDTPPISQCADGLAVATIAGRVLILSRAQRTSYKDIQEMLRRLAPTQSKILGAVLNHF
jgi:receptor protein-tyrosine kinase